jgi:predicted nucleotidyltransferase
MLEPLSLTKSRVRRDLLTLFFTNPSQRYYLRELQRLLGYSAGNIRRELLKFQQDDLLTTQRVGNLLYYAVNAAHPLFKELKSIVTKTVGVEGILKATLSTIDDIAIAFIYGSFAAKKETGSSDIDLMIIGSPNTSALHEALARVEQKLQREVNPTIYSMDEYRAKKRAKRGFITELLRRPKIMLRGRADDL